MKGQASKMRAMVSSTLSSGSLRVPKRRGSDYAGDVYAAQRQALAQAISGLRLQQGLSQEALAYEAEVERSYVSLIERGQGNPSLRVLCQLAQRLGVTPAELLGGMMEDVATDQSMALAGHARAYTAKTTRAAIVLHDSAVEVCDGFAHKKTKR